MDDGAASVAEPPRPVAMQGSTVAAILMLLLEDGDAAAILKHLDPLEIKTLGKAMFAASEATDADILTALDSFSERSGSISAFAGTVDPRVRNVMAQALGNVRAENILANIAPQGSVGVLDLVRWMERPALIRFFADEHPQLSAIVLSVLTPEVAAEILETLDDLVQADLVYRAARLTKVRSEALADLEVVLATYTQIESAGTSLALGGKTDVAKIVNRLKKPTGARILKSVKKLNRALGEQIEEEMFTFDNLIELDAQALGEVLRAVDAAMLGLALRGGSDALIEKMLGTMSARAALSVRDDMAERGPVKREEVEAAQRQIVSIARRLADDGQLQLGGGGGDYV